jgi:LmbE family N-acetylglucosaminyl deacetylase
MVMSSHDAHVAEPPNTGRALVIAAHPDDIESWCAGTLARMIDAGLAVDYLLLTSGDKGFDNPHLTGAEVGALREREQREAAERLGVRRVEFLRHLDGELEDSRALREQVVRSVRRLRPDIVFTHDPDRPYPPYTTHRDHRVAGRVVLDAIYPAARDRRSFPEHLAAGLEPHAVQQVWLFCSAAPDTWVDIAKSFDRKLAARLAHRSQTKDADALRANWRDRAAAVGAQVNLGLAEAFVVLHLN